MVWSLLKKKTYLKKKKEEMSALSVCWTVRGAALAELSPAGERDHRRRSNDTCRGPPEGISGHSCPDRQFSEETTLKLLPCRRRGSRFQAEGTACAKAKRQGVRVSSLH